MTHFKLYLKALKKFSRAFILARGLFTFGHLLMITLYVLTLARFPYFATFASGGGGGGGGPLAIGPWWS